MEVQPPKVFTGQTELYNKLMENGIDVYVISAASEDLVRMVASDPKYGYNVKPQNVIGVSLLLKNRTTGQLTTPRKQISEGNYDAKANQELELTPYLWTPATWMAGKQAAILTYIDEWKSPCWSAATPHQRWLHAVSQRRCEQGRHPSMGQPQGQVHGPDERDDRQERSGPGQGRAAGDGGQELGDRDAGADSVAPVLLDWIRG